jgi:hypothetical protein
MIPIDRGNGIEEVEETILDGPFYRLIDTDREHTEVTVYILDGKVVHRSAHITLKG